MNRSAERSIKVLGVLVGIGAIASILLVAGHLAPSTLFRGEGRFGEVRVVEHANGLRSLYIGEGRARQTSLDPDRPRHLDLPYTRVAMAGLALVPTDARLLFVGLGGGAMPTYVRSVRASIRIDVVEIDPMVVDLARRFFGFSTDSLLRVHVADGRDFVEQAPPSSWHAVFLDAFADDAIPRALATRQFLKGVRRAVLPDGVVVANLWTSVPEYASMVATYRAVFAHVALIHVPGRRQVILLATDREGALEREALVEAVRAATGPAALGFDLEALVAAGHTRTLPSGGAVLSDPPGDAYPVGPGPPPTTPYPR